MYNLVDALRQFGRQVHFRQMDTAVFKINPSTQRIDDGAGLLENLLLHEMFELPFGGADRIPGDGLDSGVMVHGRLNPSPGSCCGVRWAIWPIFQENHLACVFQNGGNVGSEEHFIVAQAEGDAASVAQTGAKQLVGSIDVP